MAKSQPVKVSAPAAKIKPPVKTKADDAFEALIGTSLPLRRLVTQAKEKGSITFDQLNAAVPAEFPPEQLDELIAGLEQRGIGVVRDDALAGGSDAEARSSEDGEAETPRRPPRRRARRPRKPSSSRRNSAVPTTRSGCTCARWAPSSCSRARARSRSPSASRPAATWCWRLLRKPAHHARRDRLARRDSRRPRPAARHHRPGGDPRRDTGHGAGGQRLRSRRKPGWPPSRRKWQAGAAEAAGRGWRTVAPPGAAEVTEILVAADCQPPPRHRPSKSAARTRTRKRTAMPVTRGRAGRGGREQASRDRGGVRRGSAAAGRA